VSNTGDPQDPERYFDSASDYWRDVYGDPGVQGLIYRERMHTALRWIDGLELPTGCAALDVGCGAGLMAVELAGRGMHVTATDSSRRMASAARRQAAHAGLADRIRIMEADAHALPFSSETFDLVVALGLLPWVADPQRTLAEMGRVLRPGGWLIVTADNRVRLNLVLEPRENPLLWPVKLGLRAYRRAAGQASGSGAPSRLHLPGDVQRMLARAGLTTARQGTVGFGPFTFLGRPVLTGAMSLRVHASLRRYSAHRMKSLRRLGWHYIVAARKPEQ
jgi:ubiquinone/menaquinone biosynthesis C-methylase UbiE